MANTIRIKRRASGGSGAPSSLANAELAFNEVDSTLWYGKGTGGVGGTATTVEAIGGFGAFMSLSGDQTVAGNKIFSNTVTASISGNAGTATKLATARSISISGDLSYTVNFDGSGNVTAAGTLATVNSNIGAFTKLTVNAKGLVTAAEAAKLSDLGATSADFSMNSFKISNLADPISAQDAATKAYVDWYGFARVYNGPGQPAKYAAWLEREYKKWAPIVAKPREELTVKDLRNAGSKIIASADKAKAAIAAAAVAAPTATAVLDTAKGVMEPVSQAVATAQQAQTAWEWLIENSRFVVGVGFLGLFLVACYIAWRAMQHVEEERVNNARTGVNMRI